MGMGFKQGGHVGLGPPPPKHNRNIEKARGPLVRAEHKAMPKITGALRNKGRSRRVGR